MSSRTKASPKRVKADDYWIDKDVVSVEQLDESERVFELFQVADKFREAKREKTVQLGAGRIVALAFLEPSTRTACSFSAAAQRLGAGVIYTNAQDSSVTKGETLSDTMICLASYADAIVLRHPRLGAAAEAAAAVTKPVINAGDGTGEHPTQALLDVYTIVRETQFADFTEERKLNITFLGDAKNGRTIHSLSKLLTKLLGKALCIRYVTPEVENLAMPADIIAKLKDGGAEQSEHHELSEEILQATDVLYVTRVQKERFSEAAAYERAMRGSFKVVSETMSKLRAEALVMHPLPRVDEISTEVDEDPRNAYFKQMENGMYLRMALLAKIFGIA